MLSVGVLVTNYNSWPLALKCVEAHHQLHGEGLARIVLLDDCSPQPPPEVVPPGFVLVRNERNLGFAANLNKGVRLLGTDLVVIFDADALPLTPYLETVRTAFATEPQLGLIGFRTVDRDGQTTTAWAPEPAPSSLLLGQALSMRYYKWFGESEKKTCITAAAMALRRAAFEEVGGFDERFNWLDVDYDFSMNINRSRWTLRPEPSVVARHETGGTPITTADRIARFYANRWRLLRKHDKIASVWPAKAIILGRLVLEWLFLLGLGSWRYRKDPAERLDKLAGRRRLLADCWQHYH